MIRLNSTSHVLQLVLGGAVTTSQLDAVVCYSDHTSSAYGGGTQRSQSNDTTDVAICDAPGASTVRDIDYVSIYNADTVSATVTIKVDVSATEHILVKATLDTGERLEYTHGGGWRVLTTTGAEKTSSTVGNAPSPMGQCKFGYTSTSVCTLSRFNGKFLFINGVHETIPSAGVTIANSGLTSNDTTYYVYAYMSSGTMTLESSATASLRFWVVTVPALSTDQLKPPSVERQM